MLWPTDPNFGFIFWRPSITRHSKNSCSSRPWSPPLAVSPVTTRLSAADTLNVSSTWSARLKMLITRVMLKASFDSWQSSARFCSSVCCIVIAAVALALPAVPLLA